MPGCHVLPTSSIQEERTEGRRDDGQREMYTGVVFFLHDLSFKARSIVRDIKKVTPSLFKKNYLFVLERESGVEGQRERILSSPYTVHGT